MAPPYEESLALLCSTAFLYYHFAYLSRKALALARACLKLAVCLTLSACLLLTYKTLQHSAELAAQARLVGARVYAAVRRHTEL